jgi:hypothetical protein
MSLIACALSSLIVSSGLESREISLFNGKDLSGWTALGGGSWKVKDGVISGTSAKDQPQGILLWKDPVKDFTARCRFRIKEGDSGFYFRTERVDNSVLVHGFQVEVDTSPETGGIYETGGRGWVYKPDPKLHIESGYRAGEWTDLMVTAVGTHYIIRVNGVRITEMNDPAGRTEGRLALQLHSGQDMDVEYKDIFIRKIG